MLARADAGAVMEMTGASSADVTAPVAAIRLAAPTIPADVTAPLAVIRLAKPLAGADETDACQSDAAPTDEVTGQKAPWLTFAIISIALFMSSLDGTIVATGLPTLRHSLHTGLNWTSWTMTGYQLGLVVAMPIAGRVADSLGRKRVFLCAAALFTASSLLCGLATGIGMLIALRVVQAAGGAAFMPSASGIVMDSFGKHRHRALGMFSSIFPLGALVGPIAGGIIIATWSWRGVFLVNVPIGIAFTLLAWRFLPSSTRQGGRPDFLGALFLGGGVLGLMLAITDAGSKTVGLVSPACALPFLFCVCCFWAFLRHCARVENPLIPLHMLKGRVFPATNAVNFVWGACAIGFGSLVPLFAEERYGLTPLASGTLLTARAVGEIMLAVFAAVLIHRTGYRVPIIFGIGLIASGLAMIATHPVFLSPYAWLTVGACITGLGTGLSAPAANNASIELAPDDVGSITGLRGACRQGGAIVGIAMVTSIAAHTGHEVESLTHAFFVLAALLLCIVPLVFLIPDGRRAGDEGHEAVMMSPRPNPASATT
ncbi:MAG TPA: MFS transporter [Acidimicrobiales bacterium]|nr:MFS transporter [Acidimicrobiales bacterium]